ncbi:MAG: entericidin EcnA/B family protein [Oceanicola sp.]|jgi:predicted small secreted protein|nr:entericidin EcnA/B family protein [Oceanicola sp.]
MKYLLPMALVALVALTGCATVEGLGQDISAGARTVGDLL